MRADASFAVSVKLWALLCVFAGVTIGGNVLLTCILTGGALLYLVLQRNFRLAASYGCFYLLLALLLYGIRFHGLRMPAFSRTRNIRAKTMTLGIEHVFILATARASLICIPCPPSGF